MSKFSIKASVSDLPDIEMVNNVISKLVKKHIDNDKLVKALISIDDQTKEDIADTVIVDFQRYMKEIFQDGCTVYPKDYFKKEFLKDGCKTFPIIRENIVGKTFPEGINSVDEYIQSLDDECSTERELIASISNVVPTADGIIINVQTEHKDKIKPLIKERLKLEKNSHFSEEAINEKLEFEIEYNFVRFEKFYTKKNIKSKKNQIQF